MAALMLVMLLGLAMPSAFGGPASAQPPSLVNGKWETPREFDCDRNGDGSIGTNGLPADPTTYETHYQVVSQGNNLGSFLVVGSSTILAYSYDQFVNLWQPENPANPTVVAQNPFRTHGSHNKNGKFAPAVRCYEVPSPRPEFPYLYIDHDRTPTADELSQNRALVPGAEYTVSGSRYWYVTVTGPGQGAASGAGKHHHDRRHHRH
jgi:hypothetical protein